MTKGKYVRTEEIKEKNRLSMKKLYDNGYISHRKCKKRPDLSKYNKEFKHLRKGKNNGRWKKGYLTEGEKNGRWLGGISFEIYPKEFSFDLKKVIRKRDKYKCKLCYKTQKQNRRKLDIHHIDYNKNNNNKYNLISLCRKCHAMTSFNRNKWRKFFNGNK